MVLRAPERGAEDLAERCVVAQYLAGGRGVAGAKQVLRAEPRRIEPQRFGDPVHVHFDGEFRLRSAEAPKGAVGRRIGEHHAASDPHVLAAIGPGCVQRSAREHHR
jgi:hypothetical protein